jgi:hypothetical protein
MLLTIPYPSSPFEGSCNRVVPNGGSFGTTERGVEMTSSYWVTFSDRKPGSIEVSKGEDANAIARSFGDVKSIDILPYPADPKLNERGEHPCPAFCYSPRQCKGRTCCPKSYACSE